MGAGQSRPEADEKVFYNETPIQFSQDVVNHLSDQLASPDVSPDRQSTLDVHVRSRIQAELSRLREEEQTVREEIERTLEKENLDRERSLAGEEAAGADGASGTVKNSGVLLADLEEIQGKVERFQTRRGLAELPEVKAKGEAVASCYKVNATHPLNCWKEVSDFKATVAQVEQKYVDSLR